MRRAKSSSATSEQAAATGSGATGDGAEVKLTATQAAQLSRLAGAPFNGSSRLAKGNGWDTRVIHALEALKLVRVVKGSARKASDGLLVMLTADGFSRAKGGA